ncbi:MAG TPA: trypsin-like peptidase domain-containing protein [Gemmatimonadales bacterium]|nr:trypsin-like peptidase domain-containing protein [Gemmatimonadales bacterium]
MDFSVVAERLRRAVVEIRSDAGRGAGCGIAWRAGLVVTSAHVVDGHRATAVVAGEPRPATVLARDPVRDLALLAPAGGAPPAPPVRDSRSLRVGELVLAIGAPFGVPGAVAAGIVHATERRGPLGTRWVVADIRLFPGNSGGPLADAAGAVVGVNAMIVGGLACAVPSDVIDEFVDGALRRARPDEAA